MDILYFMLAKKGQYKNYEKKKIAINTPKSLLNTSSV